MAAKPCYIIHDVTFIKKKKRKKKRKENSNVNAEDVFLHLLELKCHVTLTGVITRSLHE